jgi:hypothetical protein
MCLARLDSSLKQKRAYKQRIGWKVFRHYESKLFFAIMFHNNKSECPTNRWLTSNKKGRISCADTDQRYKPRFHVFLHKPKTNIDDYEVVRKVKFKQPVATGWQDGHPIVVATKIFVEKQ